MKNISELYGSCFLCPRRCGVRRLSGTSPGLLRKAQGYCGESAQLRLACASIHRGEEPPLTSGPVSGPDSGAAGSGSGTIFVSGCNLGCVFCQNRQISFLASPSQKRQAEGTLGRVVETAEFARICLTLAEKGAVNINIVTGSHAVPAIVEGITAARAAGLAIPVLWNSSAYELPETLELLADTVDVYLPDLKTLDSGIAGRYFNAPDYPEIAAAAIRKMLALRPRGLEWMPRGLKQDPARPAGFGADTPAALVSGVMVRHLVLPGHLEASRRVLRWFADHCAGQALLSLMFQYTPTGPETAESSPDRYLTKEEYDTILEWLSELGIEDGYCQELVPGADWLPDFRRANPFPVGMALPVWHWREGFL